MIAEGEYAAAWYTITGTHHGHLGPFAPTGKKFEVEEIAIFCVRDGKAVEQRNVLEVLQMMQQLGILPAPPYAT